MIEKQIEDLENLKEGLVRGIIIGASERVIDSAIDTIKVLSAKVQAQNLHDGWHIVADGDLPTKPYKGE